MLTGTRPLQLWDCGPHDHGAHYWLQYGPDLLVGWFSFYSGLPGEACFSEGVWYVRLDCLCGIS